MEVAQNAGMEGERIFEDAFAALRRSFLVHEAVGNEYELAVVENFVGFAHSPRSSRHAGLS